MIIIAEMDSKLNAPKGHTSHQRAKTNVCNAPEDIFANKEEQKFESSAQKVSILLQVTLKGVWTVQRGMHAGGEE